jgi:hypothetical protein
MRDSDGVEGHDHDRGLAHDLQTLSVSNRRHLLRLVLGAGIVPWIG